MVMTQQPRIARTVFLVLCALTIGPPWAPPGHARAQGASANPDAAMADFRTRVSEYRALSARIERTIPPVPTNATPEQIDAGQRFLSQGIMLARAKAKPGDLCPPAAQASLKQALATVFRGTAGRQLRSSILDENPIGTPVTVNGLYPDSVPLSTMPPQVLEVLPPLDEPLEYRFVGDRLIFFDSHAHLIVDFIDGALPGV